MADQPGVDWAIATSIFLALLGVELPIIGLIVNNNRQNNKILKEDQEIFFNRVYDMLQTRMKKDDEQDKIINELNMRIYKIELKLGIANGGDKPKEKK